jgi:hypothetical protein
MRRNLGVGILALSVIYSALDLFGWLRPTLLRLRIHEGPRRTLAIVLGSLFFKAVVLTGGALLTFWPGRPPRRS